MNKDIKIAFCGCGNIALAHLKDINKIPNVQVRACWNRQEESALAEEFKAQSKADYCAKDFTQIAEDQEIDAVYICTMQNDRIRLLNAFAQAGKAVFMEKPLALYPHEFREMNNILRKYPIYFQSGYKIRFNSLFRKAQAELPQPEIIYAHVHDNAWSETAPASKQEIGGGHILSQGVYASEMLYLFAQSEPKTVLASSFKSGNGNSNSGSLSAIYRFENGAIGTLSITDTGLPEDSISKFYLEASGSEKSIVLKSRFSRLDVKTKENQWGENADENGFSEQSKSFFASLLNKSKPKCSFIDGVRPSFMIFRAFEAAEQHKELSLNMHEWLDSSSPSDTSSKEF